MQAKPHSARLPSVCQGAILSAALVLALAPGTANASAMADSAEQPATGAPVDAAAEIARLHQELAAQQAINAQLKQRVATLELALSEQRGPTALQAGSLDAAAEPPRESDEDFGRSAIEQALVSRGVVLLPVGHMRLTAASAWSRSGSGADTNNAFVQSLGLERGLPWGLAAGVTVPYLWRTGPLGSNSGIGDISASLAKRISNERGALPSLVMRASYRFATGSDPFTLPSIGKGFASASLGISAVKRMSPAVLYGGLAWSHTLPGQAKLKLRDGTVLFDGRIRPGDEWSLNAGISLAVSPDLTLDSGFSTSFVSTTRARSLAGNEGRFADPAVVAAFNIGAGMVLSRRLYLAVNASAGVTDEASDFTLAISLPYRF